MEVDHDPPSTMEVVRIYIGLWFSLAPPGPRQPPGGLLGVPGASRMRVPFPAPEVLAGGTGGILHVGGLASSTRVLELRTVYGTGHVILRPTFPACCPSHVMESCNTIPLLG
jgi:hypothetical protein